MSTLITGIKDKKNSCISLFSLSLFYFASRLAFLWQIPLFEDEALFTGWSLQMAKNITQFNLPLANGIAPLFTWLTSLLVFFIPNQFMAGRLLSLLAGWLLVILLYLLLTNILKFKFPLLLTTIFVLLPIMFVYNRLALLDSLLVLFSFTAVVISTDLFKDFSLTNIACYSLVLTLALLTKQLALIITIAVIGSFIYLHRKINKKTASLLIASLFSLAIFILIYLPYGKTSLSFLADYVYLPTNFASTFLHVKKNIWLSFHWLKSYYGIFLLFLVMIGWLLCLVSHKKILTFLAIVFGLTFLGIVTSSNFYFPRHTLIFAPFMIIFVGKISQKLAEQSKRLALAFLIGLMVILLNADWQLIKEPETNQVMAKEDIFQFYQDWTSGKALAATAQYFKQQSTQFSQLTIWTDKANLYYYALPLYLKDTNNIAVKRLPSTKEKLLALSNKKPKGQFVMASKQLPYNIKTMETKIIPVSSRYLIEIIRIK